MGREMVRLLKLLELGLRARCCVFKACDAGRGQLELGVSLLQLLVYGTQVCREIFAIEG